MTVGVGAGTIAPDTTAAHSTVALPVSALAPNDYNPNEMTEAQFAELVAEVAHLGRLPKPVIVRPNGAGGYVIVDGEHGWRAAVKQGLADVPCEIVDVDDFEARRQTYKRNQHGTHHPVKLGQMFRSMMAARGLSQRELAAAVEVSEGTIRNGLLYAKAADVRNDYAFDKLSVRQVRAYLAWPRVLGDAWLRCGADLDACIYQSRRRPRGMSRAQRDADAAILDRSEAKDESLCAWLIEAGLAEFLPRCYDPAGFRKAIKQLETWRYWERSWCLRGLTPAMLRPYTRHYFAQNFVLREKDMIEAVLSLLIDPTSTPARFLLTPEQFADAVAPPFNGQDSHTLFRERLDVAVVAAGHPLPTRAWRSGKRYLMEAEINASAPEYIKQSRLPLPHKFAVWKTDAPQGVDATVAKETRRKLACETRLNVIEEGDDGPRDAVRCAMDLAQRKKNAKDMYRTCSHEEIAGHIARFVPIYDAAADAAAIETLTTTLSHLTKGELMCLAEVANHWRWEESLVTLLKAMRGAV